MNHAKQQHYVPQLYLRQFASVRGKNPRLYAFDKTSQRSFATGMRNVAAELHFYEKGDRAAERAFQRLEDLFVGPFRRALIVNNLSELAAEEIAAIAVFLAAQIIRTREHREHIRSITQQLAEVLEADGWHDPELTSVDEDRLRDIQLNSLPTTSTELSNVMVRMRWVITVNHTKLPLWTSDHPTSVYNPIKQPLLGNLGLMCRGIQMFFPLSPKRLLCLCDPVEYAGFPARIDSHDENHVLFHNHLQLRTSTRFIFSNTSDFSLARHLLAQEPQFGELHRPR